MIDEKTMGRLQDLSRLKLDLSEEKELADQLEEILAYFEVLSRYDTSGIDPDLGVSVTPEQLRQDSAAVSATSGAIESFAVEFEEGHFVVPRILGDEGDG